MPELPDDVTQVLNSMEVEERAAVGNLLPAVYEGLRRMAEALFRKERPDHSLEPTALVHEAYVRMSKSDSGRWMSREHFFRAAAVAMRHILVNHARDRDR